MRQKMHTPTFHLFFRWNNVERHHSYLKIESIIGLSGINYYIP